MKLDASKLMDGAEEGADMAGTVASVRVFLLLSDTGLSVVDVKRRLQLSKPKVSFTLAWTKDVVERHSWRYGVWSEPLEAELGNLRFFAAFLRGWLLDRNLLDELRAADFKGMSLREACKSLPNWPEPLVRSAIFHLLWTEHFALDLTRPLSPSHVLTAWNSSTEISRVIAPSSCALLRRRPSPSPPGRPRPPVRGVRAAPPLIPARPGLSGPRGTAGIRHEWPRT